MSDIVRWGILGSSAFAREQMGPAIHAAHGAELAALATRTPDRAAGFQAFAPGLRVHDSYEALLADPGIDAVYVPLPNHLHVEWALKALDAGKAVLVEKPLGLRAEDFDAVIAKRDATGLLAAEAFMIVHHPQFLRARNLVAEGAIGKLVLVDTVFSYDNRDETENIRNHADTGGGGLPDIGVYAFGAARFVTGEEPREITFANLRFENGVDVFAQVAAAFPSFDYQGVVSMRMSTRQEITFQGDKGFIRLTCPFNANVHDVPQLILDDGSAAVHVERFVRENQYVIQVENFGHSMRTGVPYPCPLEFSRGTQAMIDMVFAKAG